MYWFIARSPADLAADKYPILGSSLKIFSIAALVVTKTKNKGYAGSLEVARLTNWFRENILKEINYR